MPQPLDDIVSLQDALKELGSAEELFQGIPDWMSELHEEHSARLDEITKLEEEIEEARHERRTCDAEIADAQERLNRYQQQINQVSTQREYGALLQEIDTTKRQIADAEERGLAAIERRDDSDTALAAAREAFAELDERYKRELDKWEAQKPEIGAQIELLNGRIKTLRERIPLPVLRGFDRMLERLGGDALAPVLQVDRGKGPRIWHCGGCNYRVRPQAVVEIRNSGNLVHCDSCKRILFLPSEDEE